tara:strand:+ start:3605 stop:4372 length:768 start_codon:yes stop_codon:yes gene_type:complete
MYKQKLSLASIILKNKDKFIYDILDIDFYLNPISGLRHLYNFILNNEKKIDGDVFEFGCFNGKSLLAQAIILKKIKSNKIIYGFDNFKGFPKYHKYDDFKFLKKNKDIYQKHLINKKIREFIVGKKINEKNISQSFDFSNQSKKKLLKKIKMLKLDNIKLIEGNFSETVPRFFKNYKKKIMCANIDSDLYESYETTLPYVYKYLSKGGYIHLDEYYSLKFPGAKIATDKFLKKNKIKLKKNKTYDWEFKRYYIKK